MPLRVTLRLAPSAAAAWIAAFVCTHDPDSAPAIGASLWLAVAILVVVLCTVGVRRSHLPTLIVTVALAAAAAAATHVALAQPAREAAVAATGGSRDLVMHAQVVGKVEERREALVFDAIATRVESASMRQSINVPVVVRVAAEDVEGRRALDVGAQIAVRGTAVQSWPGKREALEIVADRGVTVIQPPDGVPAVAAALRQRLVDATTGLPGEGAGLIPGIAVGDTSIVSAELDAAMKDSSLSHLTAVSGSNCALVVGLAFVAAASLHASRRVRVGCGLMVLTGFVVLVTPEPSVARAAAMAAITMITVLLGRPGAGVATLSIAIAALLIGDPWLAGSLGFALSAAATASLLLCARPISAGLGRLMPRMLALALAVPLAAQLACGPLLVLIAPQVSAYGVLANLIAAPAAPIGTLLGLAGCLAAPIQPLQQGLVTLAWLPATWIAATASAVAGMPGGLIPWPEGWGGAVTLAGVSLSIGLAISIRGRTVSQRMLRWLSVVTVCVVVGATAGGSLLSGGAGRWTLPADWSVLACDVGQGDAVLLRSGSAVALVDTGPAPEPLDACLNRAGVDRIDLLVLTHFDLDHAGGLSAVEGRVGVLLHGPLGSGDGIAVDRMVSSGARAVEAARGLTGRLGDARWRVLWPAERDETAHPPGNDSSVVLDVRGGGIPATLLLGDLSTSPQQALKASAAMVPPYAVVKVAHHGSADQDPRLYAAARPSAALISVGADNNYGHPRAEILRVLADAGATIARTDEDGVVAVSVAHDGIVVWRDRGG
jgi:competence protein ComEC